MSQLDPPNPMPVFDWRTALQEHDRWLRLVVLARLGESQPLDDVMQEVALAAARGAHRVRDPAKAAAWLYRLAVTAALQHRRRMGRRRKLLDRYRHRAQVAEPNIGGATHVDDPLDWLIAREQRQLVRDALGGIPPRLAEVLLLKYTQDWSYAELAERLGITEAAVDGRLQRARAKLRSALRQADPSLIEHAT